MQWALQKRGILEVDMAKKKSARQPAKRAQEPVGTSHRISLKFGSLPDGITTCRLGSLKRYGRPHAYAALRKQCLPNPPTRAKQRMHAFREPH